MSKKGFILWLFTETPLHAGVGSGLGDIDLPLQRERTTGLPYIQASGIKGALRAFFEQLAKDRSEATEASSEKQTSSTQQEPDSQGLEKLTKALFGPKTEEAHEHAGALALSDARLLLFPVRSLAGVWAWITSPLLLGRLQGDIERFKPDKEKSGENLPQEIQNLANALEELLRSPIKQPHIGSGSEITLNMNGQNKLILEDMVYRVQEKSEIGKLAEALKAALPEGSYWQGAMDKHLAILPDEEFQFFAENATEVITRVRIDQETKTVQEGALWTEELLPSETLLYVMGVVEDSHERRDGEPIFRAQTLYKELKAYLHGRCVQIGGDSTLGRGWCYLSLQELEKENNSQGR